MSETIKKKTCWNCEATVELAQENCLFCGVYLSPTTEKQEESPYHILTPPYRSIANVEDQVPVAPYNQNSLSEETQTEDFSINQTVSLKLLVTTIALLFLGSIFLLFGSMMLVFSQNGFLTLRWSSDYTLVYLSLSIILIFLGWRSLNRIVD